MSSDFEPISKGVNLLMHSRRAWKKLSYPVWCDYSGQKPLKTAPPTPKATSLALIALLKAGKSTYFDFLSFDSLVQEQPRGFLKAGRGWGVLKYDRGYGRSITVDTSYAIVALVEGKGSTSIIQNGINWLKASQNEDGGWGRPRVHKTSEIESTALAITALLRAGESSKDITVRNGVKWLLSKQLKDNWGSDTPLVILALHDFIAKPL